MTVLRGKGFLAIATAVLVCACTPAAAADTSAAERTALMEARRSGQPVELAEAADSRTRTVAEPGGTLTTTRSVHPERVRTPAGWVPVDTTLRLAKDGAAPGATVTEIRLSGGGAQPLLRLGDADRGVAVRWPSSLPKPELDGNTARYRQAAPGVDVIARVHASGVRMTVEAASAGPLRFALDTAGVAVRDRDGGLEFVDGAGQALFAAGAPMVGVPRGGDAAQRPGRYVVTPGAVEVPLPEGPVAVELSFTGEKPNWTMVDSGFAKVSYWNSAGPAKVGTYDAGEHRLRSFFVFDTRGLAGREIDSASVTGMENWSWSCAPKPVELWRTGPVDKATTWEKQPEWLAKLSTLSVAKGYNATCPAGPVTFDVTPLIKEAAVQGLPAVTVGLRAADEADNLHWKRFENNPVLSVQFRQ
ncbi:DNRLRE domain-containing protein [Allokutzneria sp. A3M-2-11 16]|uniref:DNRLRE domain-containing protein n=1 Tax=Allokutzneria sp. A3M-2-11 16 TaxID=2962043 RepID=UPI0020B73C8E|nr:DNRLRE domain-containing protein [Allokutzneria sp. A3M-2-11 16]MCP3798183.1 DNRLRE domain-containing protein [Allokutzneria sp. A3M-2-11 16]